MSTSGSDTFHNDKNIFSILIEESPIPMALYVGREMVIKVINPAMLKTFGKDASIIGQTYYESFSQPSEQPNHKIPDDIFTSGEEYTAAEERIELVVNGTLQQGYFNFSYKPLKNSDGSVWGILNIATDVTELVQTRKKLAETKELTDTASETEHQRRLLKVIDGSPDFIALTDIKGNVTFVNPAGLDLLGLDSLAEAQRPNEDYIAVGELFKLRSEIRKAIQEKGSWAGQIMYRHFKTGELIPVQAITTAVYDHLTGELWGRATISKDLRAEIAVQQELTDQIKQYEFVTNFMPVQLWTATPEGHLDFVNQRAVDFGGEPAESAAGTSWLNFVHPDDINVCGTAWARALKTGDPYEVEFRLRDPCSENSERRRCEHIRDAASPGYARCARECRAGQQKQSQRQKDDFLAIASHELKTPVTSIKAYAQVLGAMLGKEGETKKAEMVTRLDAQVNRLTNLIGDLLDVTKINSGRLQFNKTWFDLDEAIKETVEDLQHTTKKHELVTDFKDGGKIYSDRDRISQVLTNLISNAIKYSPHADTIIISTEIKDGFVTVCVQDFGIGIPIDKTDRVFEQFYRVSGHKQHTFPGLGLGLYISSEIIKREGGKMWVNSVEGKGSTFCFSLPLNKPENEEKEL